MIEKLHEYTITNKLYQNPGEPSVYTTIGTNPPNLWEIMDKINEIIDYFNSDDREENNELLNQQTGGGGNKMTLEKAIEQLKKNYELALQNKSIKHKTAWALHITWKWAEMHETEEEHGDIQHQVQGV